MTEREWLQATEPKPMLEFLLASGKLSERKAGLFGCGCCRRIWHLLTDERSRRAVEVTELLADGLVTETLADAAREAAAAAAVEIEGNPWRDAPYQVLWRAATAAEYLLPMPVESWLLHGVWDYVATAMEGEQLVEEGATPEMLDAWSEQSVDSGRTLGWTGTNHNAIMADLLREVVGPVLFRPLPPLKSAILAWHDSVVVRLAQAAYEERHLPAGTLDNSRLAVLADALEEAGCTSEDMLDHLRGPGPHVRGCWAIDLCLGNREVLL